MTGRMLIAGVGNIFLGDDGFGPEVARRLAAVSLPGWVQVADYGTSGMHLAYDLAGGYDAAVLIDAAPRGGKPGTVTLQAPTPPPRALLAPTPPPRPRLAPAPRRRARPAEPGLAARPRHPRAQPDELARRGQDHAARAHRARPGRRACHRRHRGRPGDRAGRGADARGGLPRGAGQHRDRPPPRRGDGARRAHRAGPAGRLGGGDRERGEPGLPGPV